jgi:hypothetical protein
MELQTLRGTIRSNWTRTSHGASIAAADGGSSSSNSSSRQLMGLTLVVDIPPGLTAHVELPLLDAVLVTMDDDRMGGDVLLWSTQQWLQQREQQQQQQQQQSAVAAAAAAVEVTGVRCAQAATCHRTLLLRIGSGRYRLTASVDDDDTTRE